MKKRYLFFVFMLALLSWTTMSAQIITTISPKVRMFPSSGFSYLDDPGRYFNIQMINTSSETKEIFFVIELSCDFSATNENYYLRTRKEYQPVNPITIGAAPVLLNRSHFDQIVGNLNSNAYETNVDRSKLVGNVFTLPEGQYRFCITPYEWTGVNTPNPVQAGEQACYTFTICYTGSAPEFTSPVNGFSAANLNNSNPTNNLLAGGSAYSSDNRGSDQYTVLPLQRNLNFSWTGVISNCLAINDFDYTLKIVEVHKNQNVQDAIRDNATIATVDNKSRTSYLHDTLSNRHFALQRGHVYAAQVQATLKKNLLTEVKLSNEGKSQVIAFVWGEGEIVQEQEGNTSSSVTDNREQILTTIRNPYFVTPGKDQKTLTELKTRLSGEAANEPTNNPISTYVTEGEPYYQLSPMDSLPIQWMPVRGDSVFRVKYTASLYEYVGGPVENSLNIQPIHSMDVSCDAPKSSFGIDNTQLMTLSQNWKDTLEEGFKYVINLKAETFYSYNEKTTYTITEYVHNMPTTRDSVVNKTLFATDVLQSNVIFAWGIDSGALDKVYPPQFTYPVDLSERAWNDSTWTDLPDVSKRESFAFRWKSATGVDYQDSVYYKLSVAELPKGKKPQEVTTMLFTKDSISATEYIDSLLLDTLKVDKQYLARVDVWVKQTEDTSTHYNLLNNGHSLYATFKLKSPPEFVADLNDKVKCFPKALDELSKEIITPKADSLISNRVQLKIGDFPFVMQTAKYDAEKKVYNGDGYVVWHPLGVDVRLKVQFDSIQINKNYEVVKGTAVSTATDSSTYLEALTNNIDMKEWTNDDVNAVVSKLGENEKIKGYYDKFQQYGEKYAKKYGGLLGPLVGENIATEVLTFPLSITDDEITGSDNVIFAINNMYFSPVTALMNIWAIFAAQSDNMYVPFLANNICMDQQGFLGNSSQHIELYMGRDYEVELNDGYKMRFKKSSKFADPKDGTVLIVDTGKLDYMLAEIQFDMNSNDVLGIEADGTPRKGKVVHADLLTKIKDWDNWVAKITMDPFAIADCDRFTFVPTGKGIFYDHSSTETPKEITFPKGYFPESSNNSQTNQGKGSTDGQDGKNKKGDEAAAKANKEWQGFYWDEMTVFLSDEISNTFVDEDKENKDSMVTYSYGINGTIKDSVHYSYPGSRINFGAKQLLIDHDGFTAELFARDLVRAETESAGGWAFSLDTISVKFEKNKYKFGVIQGGFGIPLFSGGFKYNCSIGADSLEFGVSATKDTLVLDMWIAKVNFDNKSSYFKIKKIYKEPNTRIDLTMNGHINVDFNKIGIPVNCPLAKFEHMGMRNYNMSGKPKEGTASIEKFEFDIGDWSFASPQKTIGGAPSNADGMQVNEKNKPIGSVSFGGFTFSLTKFDPIVGFEKTDLKLGFSVGGQIKFATEGTDLGASCGFSVWGVVEPTNHFHVKKVDSKLESITFDNIDFEVFKLDGKLDFFDKSTSSTMGDGFGGSLSVSFMSKVKLTMKAGFGTKSNGNSKYTWWYFDGACKFLGGIPLGAVSINGFSGGFAYNMKAKKSLSDPSYSAVNLLKQADKNTNENATFASGIDYEPAKDNWVANAGISMILTGSENTMNADGLVSLRIANKHFSGIFIDANAYVLTNMDKTKTPGDGKNNSSPLVQARAILGFETTKTYDYFRLSIAAKADISLTKLLEGASSTVLGAALGAVHSGTSMITSSNVTQKLNNLLNGSSGLTSHGVNEREEAADASTSGSSIMPSFGVKVSIPIDFELKHYKKQEGNHKSGSTDWYFAIGKPKYSERVQISSQLNMVVYTSNVDFTFYMQTGNAFAYQMPPLSSNLKKFFGFEDDDKKMDTDEEGVKNTRKIKNTDWLTIDNGGGFCLGSTFHSYLALDMFLYVHVTADLGFDVALLDVGGMGCPGHSQIGKHNFYALGRAYAALQGDVGLKLNLGFWKGEISLFSAGIGALLQGGAPNPSYAYGMLRFKISMLNGLLKFSTSVDFSVGDVCVPGAGDPLANVKLFQNVTPGFETESTAKSKSNQQSPLQVGVIVSNMPWDKEVYLADNDGKNARKFWFTLINSKIKYQTRQSASGSYTTTTGNNRLQFYPSRDDANTLFFETLDGGFVENCYNKLYLEARGFEWRKVVPSKELKSVSNTARKDWPYYVTGDSKGTMKSYSTSGYDWFDPTFMDENSGKQIVKEYERDTTLFFQTKALGNQLYNEVVYSWPFNGEKVFPSKEYVHSGSGSNTTPYCMLYLYRRRDNLFDPTTLSNSGKQLKIFLLGYNGDAGDVQECSYTYYPSADVPYVKVKMPKSEYGTMGCGPHKLKFLLVEKGSYQSAMEAANKAMKATIKQNEYSSRISNSTYTQATNAHNSNKGTTVTKNGKRVTVKPDINIQNQQLEEIYNSKINDGKDSMVYTRTKLKQDYKICSSVGDCIYEWTWFVDFNYETYAEYYARHLSSSCYDYSKDVCNYDNLGDALKNAAVTVYSSSITVKLKPKQYNYRLQDPFFTMASYDPQDPYRYNTQCVMPPRAFLVLNNGGDVNLARMHSTYFQNLIDMERDFKKTPLLLYRHSDSSGDVDYVSNPSASVTDYTLKSELNRILQGGFVDNYTTSFKAIDLRIKGGTNFTQCAANGYHPNTVDVPCILDVSVSSGWEPMDDKYFLPEYASRLSLSYDPGYSHTLTITDYATHAIVDDIKKIHDFMQLNQQHAQAFNKRGWSHKADYFKDFYSNKYKNARFSHNNFPYDIPEIYIATHYMTALDAFYSGNKSSYTTPSGRTLKFYNKNEDFIYVSDLQLKDAMWAKYWWSADGQCLDREVNGFDRDFYFKSSSTKYYNVANNQSNDGKHNNSSTQSSVFGKWYNTNLYNSVPYNLSNNVAFYYMTSQEANFESNLMKIAKAVKLGKVQTSRIFYPNAKYVPRNCYYTVPTKNTTISTKLSDSGKLQIKNDNDSSDFNY